LSVEDQQHHDPCLMKQMKTNFSIMKYHCLINLAKCKRKMNQPDIAIDHCTQALSINITPDALLLRARIKRDQRLFEDAYNDLLEAKKLEPNSTELDRYIARVKDDLLKTKNNRQETVL